MTDNPYANPPTDSLVGSINPQQLEGSMRHDGSLLTIARSVFLAWEKLRILYIGILTLITLTLVGIAGRITVGILAMVVMGAVVSNVAYFAGPTIETYVRWLGYNRIWPRWLMFGCGTVLSMALAIILLMAELFPNLL